MATENGTDENAKTDGKSQAAGKTEGKRAVTPVTVTHPENVSIESIRLFREPPWILRLTIQDDRSYLRVKIVRAAPLSHPNRYICILDTKDEEICMIDDPKLLESEMADIVKEELDRRYLTSTIERVTSVRNEFGTSYWDVLTNRGEREFVMQNASENAQWLGDHRLLLVDVDGNRFEIPDLNALDKKSLRYVELVL